MSAPGAGLYDEGRYRRVRNRVRSEMIRDTPVAEELLAAITQNSLGWLERAKQAAAGDD